MYFDYMLLLSSQIWFYCCYSINAINFWNKYEFISSSGCYSSNNWLDEYMKYNILDMIILILSHSLFTSIWRNVHFNARLIYMNQKSFWSNGTFGIAHIIIDEIISNSTEYACLSCNCVYKKDKEMEKICHIRYKNDCFPAKS